MHDMRFVWISHNALPSKWDLTSVGWSEVAGHRADRRTLWLYDWSDGRPMGCPILFEQALCVAVGVDRSEDCAHLLAEGVAEAVPSDIELIELAWRMTRILAQARRTDTVRHAGPVQLDLLRRDGVLVGRRVAASFAGFSDARRENEGVLPDRELDREWAMQHEGAAIARAG